MKKKNFIPLIAIAVLCAACHDKTTLTGDWIEPVPGNTNTIQGFSLKENGEATSINMATLQYKSWAQEDNRLILSGESIGNQQTISFSDTSFPLAAWRIAVVRSAGIPISSFSSRIASTSINGSNSSSNAGIGLM